MRREELIEIVHRAVAAEGYAFHTGEVHTVGGIVRVWPAAWLSPPAMQKIDGRREGEATWRVTLHFMALPAGSSAESLWSTLERDALSVAGGIAADEAVCAIANVSCTPARGSLTPQGEVSVALQADITLWFTV